MNEMVEFLQRAWNYRPYLPVETVINWVESFAEFSLNAGRDFDADMLGKSREWQGLMRWVIVSG